MSNLQSLLNKIAKLRVRTVANGASEAEADTTARILGRLLMDNPELQVVIGGGDQPRIESPTTGWVVLEGFQEIRRSDKAMLFATERGTVWIPKSVIDFSKTWLPGGMVCVKQWFVEKELGHIYAGAC